MMTRAMARRRPALRAAVANQAADAERLPGSAGTLVKMIMVSAFSVASLGGCAAAFQNSPGTPPNYYIHQLSLEGGGG